MKKIIIALLLVCISFNICMSASALSPAYLNSVSILGDEAIIMHVGDEITLSAVADSQGINVAYMYWKADNSNVVSLIGDNGTTKNTSLISNATITALDVGKTEIFVYADTNIVAEPEDYYENDSIIINVIPNGENFISKVEPEFIWYDMYVGEELNIDAIAHTVGADFAYFRWNADNENIIEITDIDSTNVVSPFKSTVTITALSKGITTLYVYADCSYPITEKASCSKITINVRENNSINPPSSDVQYLSIKSDFEKTIHIGEEFSVAAIAEQDDYRREWAYFKWEVSDDSIIEICADDGTTLFTPPISIGKIKAISEGTATVTVYAGATSGKGSIYDSITINVIPEEKYTVTFYNDIPPKDSNEDDFIYHKIENLKADDIIVFPDIPQKDSYIFTGWKVLTDDGIHFTQPQPFNPLINESKYYASWCPESDYTPIKIDISTDNTITKGNENGNKITLKTNYGIFVENTNFPSQWRSAYDEETNDQTKADILDNWKSTWNIIGNDDIMIETATRIDDKTVEFTLSGNSNDKYSDSNIYIEFDNSLLMPQPYEIDGQIITSNDTKIKMDADGVRAKMYCSDNAITLSKQDRPSTGGGISTYLVKFETNGAENIKSQSVNNDNTAKEPTAPTKDGYDFAGWYLDKELTTVYDFNTKVTKSITLYAKWVDVKTQTLNIPDENDKPSETKNPFTDIKADDWYFEAVNFAFEKGITSGVTENTFAPNEKVTRAQFIVMLCRAYDIKKMTGDNFDDCHNTWYTGYLAAAKQLGISNGVGENNFAPNKEITREEMVALIYNYLKSVDKIDDEIEKINFLDSNSISDWAKPGVAFASHKGWVNGKDNNIFDAHSNATRAELAQIFYNMFN